MNQDSNSQKWFRGVIGIGLAVMIATYVISIKTDLFQADIVDNVVNNTITEEGGGLFAAAGSLSEEVVEVLAPAADSITGEDGVLPAGGVLTGEQPEEVVVPEPIPEPVVELIPEPVVIPEPVAPAAPEPEPVIIIPEPIIPDVVAVEAESAEVVEVLPDTGLNNYVVILMLIVLGWVGLMVKAKTSKE